MKKTIQNIILILIFFSLQVASSMFFSNSWSINLLGVFTVIAIWLNKPEVIKFQILPAAILIGLIQSSKFPTLTLVLLGIWLVVTILEKQWLTNHSIASLIGLAIVGEICRLFLTWGLIILAYLLNFSNTKISSTWQTTHIFWLAFLEIALIVFSGIMIRWLSKIFKQKFFYGTT